MINFKLRSVICILVVMLLLLGSYTQKQSDQKKMLQSQLDLLESSVEQVKAKNRLQFDSLQLLIQEQDQLHLRLKDSLLLLKNRRLHLKTTSDENKAAIGTIRDADSLYRLVARHYRQ